MKRAFLYLGNKTEGHHTYIMNGEGSVAAGHVWFLEGYIIEISNQSGHYQPTRTDFKHALLKMKKAYNDPNILEKAKLNLVKEWGDRPYDTEAVKDTTLEQIPSLESTYLPLKYIKRKKLSSTMVDKSFTIYAKSYWGGVEKFIDSISLETFFAIQQQHTKELEDLENKHKELWAAYYQAQEKDRQKFEEAIKRWREEQLRNLRNFIEKVKEDNEMSLKDINELESNIKRYIEGDEYIHRDDIYNRLEELISQSGIGRWHNFISSIESANLVLPPSVSGIILKQIHENSAQRLEKQKYKDAMIKIDDDIRSWLTEAYQSGKAPLRKSLSDPSKTLIK
jgi:hypothetical protein